MRKIASYCYKKIPIAKRVKNGLYVFDDFMLLPSLKPLLISSSTTSCESSTSSFHNHVSSSFQCNLEFCIETNDSLVSLNTLNLWYHKLGHSSLKIVKSVLCNCNISILNKMQFFFHLACCYDKIHKLPCSSSNTIYTQPLQLIHFDSWGPSLVQSFSDYHYYIHFVDNYSRFSLIFFKT